MPVERYRESDPLVKPTYEAIHRDPDYLSPPTWQEKLANRLRIRSELVRIFFAEFLGTFVLCSVGIGSIAQSVLSKRDIPNGNIITITLGWGVGIAFGIYACGNASGGHINPAVTLAMAILGRVSLLKVPFYMAGQYLGAFVASAAIFLVYHNSLTNYAPGVRAVPYHPNSTADIWATYPLNHVSTLEAFADQIFATSLLLIIILAVTDVRNMNVPKGMVPIVIGVGFIGLLDSFAYNCGGALNPARDLAPRVFTTIAGWGTKPFTFRNGNWFWVPIVGPHIGAVLGAWLYNIFVGAHWP